MKVSKGKTAFCFPGQLHEKPILREHPLRKDPHFERLLTKVFHQTKFDLLNFLFGGEEEEKDLSLKLQVSTYFLSMVHFYRLRASGWNPDVFAEHSMGIYSALAASEAISFEEGLYITEAVRPMKAWLQTWQRLDLPPHLAVRMMRWSIHQY